MAVEVSQGICDLCGAPSDASLQECNWLTCTFQHCEGGLYHQECLERYLRQSKLEKNRKTGFKCPRGCGKGTKFDTPCPGRIDKSHPLHPRNEDKKKTKLAAVVVEPPRQAKAAAPAAQNGKVTKAKDDAKAESGKDSKSTTPAAKAATVAKPASPGTATLSPGTQKAAAKREAAPLPPRPEVLAKQKLAELAAQARRELGLPTPGQSGLSTHGSKGDLQVLASSSAGPSKAGAAAPPSAWGKPAAAAADPPAATPQPPMMSQLPQLQQLYQAASKKPSVKVVAAAAPVAQSPKPAPAVPQPVLNPPTPVWPALGSTQCSAASLLAASGSTGGSGQTPREAAAARPASPSAAWGPAAAQSAVPAASQQPAQQTVPPLTSSVSRQLMSAGSSDALSPVTAAAATLAGASAPPSAAGAAGGGAPAAAPREGTTAAAGDSEPSTSGRGVVAGGQQGAAAPADPLSAATSSQSLVDPVQQAVSDGAEEEVKEPKLTKSQKKNLKRQEKKKGPQAAAAQQAQAGSEAQPESHAAASVSAPAAASSSSRLAAAPAASAPAAGSGAHKRHGSRGSDQPERSDAVGAEAEAALPLEELCISGIVTQKVRSLVSKLQRLGAPDFVAAAAVQRHGSNLPAALEWLLVAGASAAEAQPEVVLTSAAQSAAAAEPEVDISEELQQLSDVQAAIGAPPELLYQCVVDCGGDVAGAARAAMDRLLSGAAGSEAANGAGRPCDAGADTAASGLANGPQLHASASYYSVSSLDTATSGLDHDHAKQQQPPAYSNHFGVRLVDEPVGSRGGYDGAGPYSAGLLRGGVALGAAGWPNGYIRDSPPLPAAGGRNTSRLLHWLRDGRAAALEEDAGASCGGHSGADPALESPFSAHGETARRQAASASPSLNNWLGSNGIHVPQPAPLAATTAGRSESQELFSNANSGAFSFSSAASKPSAAEHASRWGNHGGQRAEAPAGAASSSAGGATEAESVPHNDGDNDLSSIMALMNMR